MDELDDLMGSFEDNLVVSSKEESQSSDYQVDGLVQAEEGIFEDAPEEEEEEQIQPQSVEPSSNTFYGSKGLDIEQEQFRDSFKALFLKDIQGIEIFDDFVMFVSEIEDKDQRALIHKVAKTYGSNNLTKQYEFLMRFSMPVALYQMRSALGDWASEITKPLKENSKQLNSLMTAITKAESVSIASIRENGNMELDRIREFGDQIAKQIIAKSNGRSEENEKALALVEAKIKELSKSFDGTYKTKKLEILAELKTAVEGVLGSLVDDAVLELREKAKEVMEEVKGNSIQRFIYTAFAAFSGMYLFAVIAKHFPNFVM